MAWRIKRRASDSGMEHTRAISLKVEVVVGGNEFAIPKRWRAVMLIQELGYERPELVLDYLIGKT